MLKNKSPTSLAVFNRVDCLSISYKIYILRFAIHACGAGRCDLESIVPTFHAILVDYASQSHATVLRGRA